MAKYFIGEKVDVWDYGELKTGTIHSVRRKLFGKIVYVIAVVVPSGFDPDGIGKERYKYLEFTEDCILSTQRELNNG